MKKTIFILFAGLVLIASSAFAITSSDEPFDYSDAPGYGLAWHKTPTWQSLGSSWNSETAALTPDLDGSDDGVFWSLDGSNYGHGLVYAGQDVTFRFDMNRSNTGVHSYDQLKAWVDWDQDLTFDNIDDMIIAEKWVKDNSSTILSKQFFVTVTIPETLTGDLWLRARVHCNHVAFEDTTPYGYLSQGEVEDWCIEVAPVPEPATLILLGSGLAGLAFYRRKKK